MCGAEQSALARTVNSAKASCSTGLNRGPWGGESDLPAGKAGWLLLPPWPEEAAMLKPRGSGWPWGQWRMLLPANGARAMPARKGGGEEWHGWQCQAGGRAWWGGQGRGITARALWFLSCVASPDLFRPLDVPACCTRAPCMHAHVASARNAATTPDLPDLPGRAAPRRPEAGPWTSWSCWRLLIGRAAWFPECAPLDAAEDEAALPPGRSPTPRRPGGSMAWLRRPAGVEKRVQAGGGGWGRRRLPFHISSACVQLR